MQEPLAFLRNGIVVVCDMKDLSLFRNLDMSVECRKMFAPFPPRPIAHLAFFFFFPFYQRVSCLYGTFPHRFRDIYLVNSGLFMRAFMGVMKLLLPKKLRERLSNKSLDELKDLIPGQYLLDRYPGGQKKFTDEDHNQMIERMEAADHVIKELWRQRRKAIKAMNA